jgi:hypothetical protein
MTTPLVHHTLTWVTNQGNEWGWHCQDCSASASGFRTEEGARRVAEIHEDPSRAQLKQGSTAAATTN